ncbi:MAG: hypothetical protein COU11_00315 [Candidatus Harrisonbacteria bacterium CG10_big_fil_rev_8_21_14_0_10_49_15]|uniref:Uncharacterized protein n=1 Tax=Candidatus Harrisonbacteria bacterium CG10_big_fil_rev_8_21_14_0_10_49_15 TaxID=1974587 RepID=A0A2H0UM12_9BACT|nr:MAG: hypothetical protein COU11_00315 [Candidatus Harrisonbacteria bacterium CG10_big_fil_rev_8_21_14_0_10_49_15]
MAWIRLSCDDQKQIRETMITMALERCLIYTLLGHQCGAEPIMVWPKIELGEPEIVQLVRRHRLQLVGPLFRLLLEPEVYERRAQLEGFIKLVSEALIPSGNLQLRPELFEQALGIELLPAARMAVLPWRAWPRSSASQK